MQCTVAQCIARSLSFAQRQDLLMVIGGDRGEVLCVQPRVFSALRLPFPPLPSKQEQHQHQHQQQNQGQPRSVRRRRVHAPSKAAIADVHVAVDVGISMQIRSERFGRFVRLQA